MWQNLHTHTNFCDGKSTPEEYLHHAEKQQVFNLGLSSHAPLPFTSTWCMKPDDLTNYFNTIQQLKKNKRTEINIYTSLEIDYIPDIISPVDFQHQLDYTIGSIHFVDQFNDGLRWEIDGPHTFFMEGYEKIFKKNIKDVIARYFELTCEMIEHTTPDIVGHLDKIKIQNHDNKLFNEHDMWFKQMLFRTLDTIAGEGCIVEVNTRGLYQKKSITTYPGPIALEYILEKNIPILLSSDAHHADDLTNQFEETARYLYSLGFRNHAVFHEGEWVMCPFNSKGIEY